MLTEEEFVDATALRRRGWSISAIARHLGRDRKTVRAYVEGRREPGVRRRAVPDQFEPFVAYVRERLVDDPHLWATALFDEVVALGYPRSYVDVRAGGAPAAGCGRTARRAAGVKGRDDDRDRAPAGRGDPVGLARAAPSAVGRARRIVLVGTLPHSGRFRGVLAESQDQPHLIEAMDAVLRRLGGTARRVAHRPDGHGHRARHAGRAAELRAGREALRRDRGAVPSAARRTARARSSRATTSSRGAGGAP